MATASRTGLCAVFVVVAAISAAQSRLPTPRRRACVPTATSSLVLDPPAPATSVPYGGGAALFVGALGVASRVRRATRLG